MQIELSEEEKDLLISLIKDERLSAFINLKESEHILDHASCGNIDTQTQKRQIKEAEETITKCNELLKKFGVEE